MDKIEGTFIVMALVFLVFVIGMCFGFNRAHNDQHVNLCHVRTDTHCLWVDGHAEWR